MLILASTDWSTLSIAAIGFLLLLIAALALMLLYERFVGSQREAYIRDQERRSLAALNEAITAHNKVIANADMIVLRLTELAQVSKDVRRELLDFVKEKADDQKQLSLDIEGRLRDMIRDIEHHRVEGGHTNVNVYDGDTRQSVNHFSGDNASVAQGQSVNQTKHMG